MKTLAALLLCALMVPAFAAGPVETRDFFSAGKSFRATVEYYGSNGGGDAGITLRRGKKKISYFKTDLPPFSVTVSADGSRLFFFCGSWGRSVSIFLLEVYSAEGKKLASHRLQMSGPSGEGFSGDGRFYAVGASNEGKDTLLVLRTDTGKKVWRDTFEERITGITPAASGSGVLAVFRAGQGRHKAVLFGPGGQERWSSVIKTRRDLLPKALGKDGFELWEAGAVYNEKDGYWHARLLKKRYYSLKAGEVSPAGERELDEELR